MKKYRILIFTGFITIVCSILACTINIGGPAYPTQSIPISTEAIGQLNQSIQTAVAAGVNSGEITLVITEPELTSYLDYELSTQPDPIITHPQAYLRSGQIQIYGAAQKGYFVATVSIVVTAGVDDQGKLTIELTSADFGPLPVPNDLKGIVTAAVQEAYTGALGPIATGFRLELITVADGTMTVVGKI